MCVPIAQIYKQVLTSLKELPEINKRIKLLIDEFSNGNVADFVRLTGISSHQVLNRIFNIDKRSGNYPAPSGNILASIQMSIPEINNTWLLKGKGEMKRENVIIGVDSKIEVSKIVNLILANIDKFKEDKDFSRFLEDYKKDVIIEYQEKLISLNKKS